MLLSSVSPSVVLHNETHLNPSFNVKFKNLTIIKKDRLDRQGGGVAILVKKSIQVSPLLISSSHKVEVVGVSIFTSDVGAIDFLSVYVPIGSACDTEEITSLIDRPNRHWWRF